MQPGIADIAEPVVEFVDIELDMDFDKHFVVDKPAVVRFDPCRKVRFDLVLVRLVAGSAREKDRPANSSADGGRSQLESRETADPADAKGSEAGVPPLSAPHAPQPACSRPKVRL